MIYREEQLEILDAIDDLNQMILELNNDDTILFGFTYSSGMGLVSYGELDIWNSEDDERKYDEDTDTYEPYKDAFIRLAVLAVDQYIKVKLF